MTTSAQKTTLICIISMPLTASAVGITNRNLLPQMLRISTLDERRGND
jgi:hypothetical protein